MKKGFIIGSAILMVAAGGAVEFARSGKTATEQMIQSSRSKLASIPLNAGEWVSKNELFDDKQLQVAEAVSYVYRTFEHTKTKQKISMLIIAGNPKAIGAHDPTVCYGGAGFKQKKEEAISNTTSVDGKEHSFWVSRFDSDTFPPVSLQVHWAWTANGSWVASKSPRIDYATEPLLYKVYLSRQIDTNGESNDATEELLRQLLPEIRKVFAEQTK